MFNSAWTLSPSLSPSLSFSGLFTTIRCIKATDLPNYLDQKYLAFNHSQASAKITALRMHHRKIKPNCDLWMLRSIKHVAHKELATAQTHRPHTTDTDFQSVQPTEISTARTTKWIIKKKTLYIKQRTHIIATHTHNRHTIAHICSIYSYWNPSIHTKCIYMQTASSLRAFWIVSLSYNKICRRLPTMTEPLRPTHTHHAYIWATSMSMLEQRLFYIQLWSECLCLFFSHFIHYSTAWSYIYIRIRFVISLHSHCDNIRMYVMYICLSRCIVHIGVLHSTCRSDNWHPACNDVSRQMQTKENNTTARLMETKPKR